MDTNKDDCFDIFYNGKSYGFPNYKEVRSMENNTTNENIYCEHAGGFQEPSTTHYNQSQYDHNQHNQQQYTSPPQINRQPPSQHKSDTPVSAVLQTMAIGASLLSTILSAVSVSYSKIAVSRKASIELPSNLVDSIQELKRDVEGLSKTNEEVKKISASVGSLEKSISSMKSVDNTKEIEVIMKQVSSLQEEIKEVITKIEKTAEASKETTLPRQPQPVESERRYSEERPNAREVIKESTEVKSDEKITENKSDEKKTLNERDVKDDIKVESPKSSNVNEDNSVR